MQFFYVYMSDDWRSGFYKPEVCATNYMLCARFVSVLTAAGLYFPTRYRLRTASGPRAGFSPSAYAASYRPEEEGRSGVYLTIVRTLPNGVVKVLTAGELEPTVYYLLSPSLFPPHPHFFLSLDGSALCTGLHVVHSPMPGPFSRPHQTHMGASAFALMKLSPRRL